MSLVIIFWLVVGFSLILWRSGYERPALELSYLVNPERSSRSGDARAAGRDTIPSFP
jgi:hypothetical protein